MTASSTDIATERQSTVRPPFRADIQGLRAVAILLVVAYHAGVPGFSGGYVGVDVFFVLSGYLISLLLVQEVERTGTVSLLSFYGRRGRRLLPGLAVVLVVTIAASALIYAPYEQRFLANTAAATAGYFSNIYFARAALDYHGPAAVDNPFLHAWSLSVEEQFYLVWPLLVLFGSGVLWKQQNQRGGKFRLLLWMIIAAVVSFALSLYLTRGRPTTAFFLSPARAWEFAFGAIGVLLPVEVASAEPRVNIRDRYLSLINPRFGFAGWVGLTGIVLAGIMFDSRTTFPGVAALLPTVSTVLVLRATKGSLISRFLSIRPLTEIGRLSYSWYLWHWPVLLLADALSGPLRLSARLGLMGLSLGFAALSYRLVENPIHHNRKLALRPAYSILVSALITISVIALALIWRQGSIKWAATPKQESYSRTRRDLPVIYSMDCDQGYYSSEVKQCSFGKPDAPRQVVLFGDSHAGQWFPTIESAFVERGWRLVVLTKSGCPIVDSPVFFAPLGRIYGECEVWRLRAIATIRELQPDMLIIGSAAQYEFSRDEWKNGTDKVLTSLSESSKFVLMIRDTPRLGIDPTRCLARSNWRSKLLPSLDCKIEVTNDDDHVYRVRENSAKAFPNVSAIDMNPFILEAVRNDVSVFRDDNHLSATFARSLASDFTSQVESRCGHLDSFLTRRP